MGWNSQVGIPSEQRQKSKRSTWAVTMAHDNSLRYAGGLGGRLCFSTESVERGVYGVFRKGEIEDKGILRFAYGVFMHFSFGMY
jgi:hypothetical protein